MSKLTVKEMENILSDDIPLDKLILDNGIYEFYEENQMSIGVSYKHVDMESAGYVFNLFLKDKYINIPGFYENIKDAAKVLTQEWNIRQEKIIYPTDPSKKYLVTLENGDIVESNYVIDWDLKIEYFSEVINTGHSVIRWEEKYK